MIYWSVALRRVKLYTVTVLILIISSCTKENRKPQWDVDVLAPIANTRLTISDLIADSLYTIGPNNGITIVYEDELFSLAVDTLFAIPDTGFVYAYGLPFAGSLTVNGGTNVLSTIDQSKFGLDPIELTDLIVRSGSLTLSARSKVNTPTIADLSLQSATLNSNTLDMMLNIPPGTVANPSLVSETRNLAGYSFDLRGPLFNDVNTLTNSINLATAPSAPPVVVTNTDSLIAVVAYNSVVPEYARGYFGEQFETLNESTLVDAFNNLGGTLDLDQVKVLLKITNGIGVDAQIFLNSLNSIGNSSIALNHQITNGPINVTRATDLGGTGFIPSYQEIELNNTNSNIDLFIENFPQELQIAGDIAINPLGNISNSNDFFYYDSKLSIDIATEIPLCLIADDLTIQTIADVNLPGTTGAHAIQDGIIHLFVNNGFPLDASLAFEIYNDPSSALSIPVSNTIPSAILDASGEVIAPLETKVSIALSKEQVDRLYAAGKVRLTIFFDTAPAGQLVKIKESHFMDLQLTSDFNYVVNGDE